METKLYEWQEKCLEKWFQNSGRGIVQAVTGSGKTLLALTAADRLDDRLGGTLQVKIVVPTGALMRQWYQTLKEYLDPEIDGSAGQNCCRKLIGLRGNGHSTREKCKYMIYVINSARYELAREILAELRSGEKVMLIADECHRYESGQNRLIFEFLPYVGPYSRHFFSLGLSATLPSGQGQRYLASVLGRRIYSYGIAEASAMKTISQYDIYHIGLAFREEERAEYEEMSERMRLLYKRLLRTHSILDRLDQKERYELLRRLAGDKDRRLAETASRYMALSYQRRNLVCLAEARVKCAGDLIGRLDAGAKILVFGERISQAEELYRLLRTEYPGRVGRYHSEMGEQANKNTMERFRAGEIRILIACKAIDEGIDVPDASVGIILSGTSAQRQRIQRLGRIIRKKEEGQAFLYYLHIAESSEDSCFLPEGSGNRFYDLEYNAETGEFAHPGYDDMADAVLNRMRKEGAAEESIQEAARCLRLGSVRSDWMLDRDRMEKQLKEAEGIRRRNYWICMKRLAALRMEGGDNPFPS